MEEEEDFAGLEQPLVATPELPLHADWRHTCCKRALQSTALRTCYRISRRQSGSGQRKQAGGSELVFVAKAEASLSGPGLARVSPAQAPEIPEAQVEAAGLPSAGYRLRTSRKRFRQVVLHMYCKISPWPNPSCAFSPAQHFRKQSGEPDARRTNRPEPVLLRSPIGFGDGLVPQRDQHRIVFPEADDNHVTAARPDCQ